MNKEIPNFEIIKEYEHNEDIDKILSYLERYETDEATMLDEGQNAEIFSLADNESFSGIAAKKIREKPKLKSNDVETEFDYQEKVRKFGIKTPTPIAYVRNKVTRQEYVLMERMKAITVASVVEEDGNEQLPEKFKWINFSKKLRQYVDIMNKNDIHHRDLHEKNVMIDKETGDPIILDFGTAIRAYGEDDVYKDTCFFYDEEKGRYESYSGYYKNDERCVAGINARLKKHAVNAGQFK